MDMRSRLLALAVFGVFAGALAWVGFSMQKAAERIEPGFGNVVPPERPRGPQQRLSRETSPSRGSDAADSRGDAWRSQVERLTARLDRLSELLEQKTADYDALKTDYDHNAELLRELLVPTSDLLGRKADREESKPATATTETSEEMVAELNAELRKTRTELAELEKDAAIDELHILELEERDRYLRSAASSVLVRAGSAAVPALADLLSDRRIEVRYWAATVLGELGPDADAAVDALRDALSDSDEEVRLAARKALRRIEAP